MAASYQTVQKQASVYAGRLGERLASTIVTAYDDGRMPGEWGTDAIDDEGTPTQATSQVRRTSARGGIANRLAWIRELEEKKSSGVNSDLGVLKKQTDPGRFASHITLDVLA